MPQRSGDRPGYTTPCLKAYSDFAHSHVSDTSDITILHSVQHTDDTASDDTIASWVPRWNRSLGDSAGVDLHAAVEGAAGLLEVDAVALLEQGQVEAQHPPTRDTRASIWQRLKYDNTTIVTTAASPYPPAHITLAFMMALCTGIWLCTGMWCGDAASWSDWTAKCDGYVAFFGGSACPEHRAAPRRHNCRTLPATTRTTGGSRRLSADTSAWRR
ncbi:hypothetical protein B0T26DRAFT_747842 [Lasiosphaeria miniovina]|uniref:Uncharacterized protein n=1 Tax=Lasiosphaeria miniovina TaxID=1954250 RepID=A0AA40B4G5_9PEZI|nr:uncharacterized protein B0T26DRAFT_747842 [Lasiosphaeria miniovina]KAK0727529.1 hypothetical protein B0T26DRAFT_747842 [Lasiosphaeria miniovina]